MPPHVCEKKTDTQEEKQSSNCADHSGIETWLKGMATLMMLSTSLLGYSVLWQAPNIKMDIAKEIARLDQSDNAAKYELQTIKKDVSDIGQRVSALEIKTIKQNKE